MVGQLSYHNLELCVRHLGIAKQVLHYLKGTITLGIEWKNNPTDHRAREKYGEMGVVRYADSSYASDIKDRKSITGYYFFLGRGVITGCNKRQQTVSISTSEAKYVAVSQGAREDVWIRRLLNELLLNKAIREIKMLGNNEISFILTRDPESQNRTKHINVIHHHIRGLVEDGEILIKWISSTDMLADGLTKAFPAGFFKRYRGEWGLIA